MRELSASLQHLFEVFNIESKRKLEVHCRELIVFRADLTSLILAAQHGALYPYLYANHFEHRVSPTLIPRKEEREALEKNGVGPYKTKAAGKFGRKVFSMFREQRSLAAHLFYTPDHKHWYLFYFDNRDKTQHSNHWMHGPHIHLICSLWPNLLLGRVWEQVQSGQLTFPSKIHLRYRSR